MALQKRFFDHFLKGEQNGWDKEPRVWLNLRRPFSQEFELRKEDAWPLEGTRWTKLFLDAEKGSLDWRASARESAATFAADSAGVTWMSPPLERETEITGPMALKLYVSSSTVDADLFVTVQAFGRPRGRVPGHDRSAYAAGAGLAAGVAPQARQSAVAALSALSRAR